MKKWPFIKMKPMNSRWLNNYYTFVVVTKTLKTMLYLLIAFGIFLMAVGIAFLSESRKSDRVQ